MSFWLLITIYLGVGTLLVLGDLCRRTFKKNSELEKISAWESIGIIINLPLYIICWPLLLVLAWLVRRGKKAVQATDAHSSRPGVSPTIHLSEPGK